MGRAKVIKPAQLLDRDPAKAEPHDAITVMAPFTFGLDLQVLHALGAFNICTTWGYWIDGKFLMNHLLPLPGVLLLHFPRNVLGYYPS